jgi:hypothetical protein
MTTSHQKEQAERRAYAGSTTEVTDYRDRAVNDIALEAQGRHSAAAKASVTGTQASVQVPRQPPGSPWSGDVPESIEPPLGYAIDDLEVTGTPAEIAESLREAASLPSGAADEATEVDFHSASGAQAPPVVLSPAGGAFLRRGRRL